MGLLRSQDNAAPRRHSHPAVATLLQLAPEKLPMDQLVRLTMSSSLANVMQKSVTALQIYPTIMPITSSMDIFRTRWEKSSTMDTISNEPTKAERIITPELMVFR